MNNNKHMVTSKCPKIPILSSKHKLTVYISSQYIQDIPKHIEQVYREDLTLKVLLALIEYELCHLEVGCKLSFIVIDFAISKDHNVGWHKAMLSRIIDLVKSHPAGNVVRFGEMWCTPDLTSPDTLTTFHKPTCNYFPMYRVLNKYIKDLMVGSGTRSIFGSISMKNSQKNWIIDPNFIS